MCHGDMSGDGTVLPPAPPPNNTVSSVRSSHSTDQLICKTPQHDVVSSECGSVSAPRADRARATLLLGLALLACGALLGGAGGWTATSAGAGGGVRRAGPALVAATAAVVAGAVAALTALLQYRQPPPPHPGGPGEQSDVGTGRYRTLLTACMVAVAGGVAASAAAAVRLHQIYVSAAPTATAHTYQEETEAWTVVASELSVLVLCGVMCALGALGAYRAARKVCACCRPKQAFEHNQFDATFEPYVVVTDEGEGGKQRGLPAPPPAHALGRQLETKLCPEFYNKQEDMSAYGTASSRVSRWLGGRVPPGSHWPPGPRAHYPPAPPPSILLLPHPAAAHTLGRLPSASGPPAPAPPVPVGMMVGGRYATLPFPPPHFYHLPDNRIRRRVSPQERRRRRRGDERRRDDKLTRSLERIYRQRQRQRLSDAELQRTYTGLDREYAEQFIAVCDSTRRGGTGGGGGRDSLPSQSTHTSDTDLEPHHHEI